MELVLTLATTPAQVHVETHIIPLDSEGERTSSSWTKMAPATLLSPMLPLVLVIPNQRFNTEVWVVRVVATFKAAKARAAKPDRLEVGQRTTPAIGAHRIAHVMTCTHDVTFQTKVGLMI